MDAYLRFLDPEIQGDSQDKDHQKWIEVTSWNWSLEQPLTTAKSTGGARTAGQVKQEGFQFEKTMDKTTFELYKHMCKGTHFKKVTLQIMRSIGEGTNHKMTFCTYEMESVVIAHFTLNGGGDDAPTETLVLNPGIVKYVYSHVDPKNPRGQQEKLPFGWDFIANKPIA